MKHIKTLSCILMLACAPSYAQEEKSKDDKHKEEVVGHCEKTQSDGKVEDIEAKDKADCKTKGGKWNKSKKDDHSHK